MSFHDIRLHFPELPDGSTVVYGALAAATRPVEDLSVSEWADRYRMVSAESGSPWPGPFRTDRVPYLREPQDCLHPDHPARRVTCRWAAQLGKSTAIENWFGFIVDQAPGSMMITLPTLEEATKFNRIKLQPTIEATPRLEHKVLPVNSRDEQGSTTFYKRYAGGFCQIVNAGSSKGLQMVSIKYLAMDEVTGYPLDVDGRGSPRDQARARQKMYGDLAKEWESSTPGIAGECAISADFEAGDQRLFYVPCPHCGTFQSFECEQLREAVSEKDLPVHMPCGACDEAILDGHKAEMLLSGVWMAQRVDEGTLEVPRLMTAEEVEAWRCPPCEGRCRDWQPSYHLPSVYAPKERFADILGRWKDAQGNTTKLRVFFQQDMALPYDPGATEVEWEKLVEAAKREPRHQPRAVPREAAMIVSAADVQGYGIKWAAFAIGPRAQAWLIDAEVFAGAPDQTDEPWVKLADALGRTYPGAGGREIGIALTGVDSGFATQRVYNFCRSRPHVMPLDGRKDQSASWIGTPKAQKVRDAKKRVIATVQLYPVFLYDVKTAVVAAMANFVGGPRIDDTSSRWPRNTLHLTSDFVDEAFAKELTGERLVDPDEEIRAVNKRRARWLVNATTRREWKRVVGRQNDWFDVAVYAFALAWYLETKRRLTAERWADLMVDVHGQDAPADLFDIAEDPFHRKRAAVKRQSLADISAKLNG